MKITRLDIRNFLSIGSASLALDDRGLILVQGENLDDDSASSNGAGKSSLPDAIAWALYGVTARGVTGDAVINLTEGKNCAVSVTLDDDGTVYRVSRHRKDKVGKNTLSVVRIESDGTESDLSKGTDRLTQPVVNQIMGCSVEVFRAAVYAGQESMPDLPGMTDKQLKLLVEEAAGVDRLQRAYELAKKEVQNADILLNTKNIALESIRVNIAAKEEELARGLAALSSWSEQHAERVSLRESAVTKREEEFARLMALHDAVEHARVEAELTAVNASLDGLEGERNRERDLILAQARHEKALGAIASQITVEMGQLRRYKEALEGVDKRVGAPCGECGKSYAHEDLDEARKRSKDKVLVQATAVKQMIADRRTPAEAALVAATAQLEDYQSSMTDASKTIMARDRLAERLKTLNAERTAIQEAARLANEGQSDLKTLLKESNPYEKLVAETRDSLKRAKNMLDGDATEGVKRAEEALSLAKEVAEVFGPAGVRAHILDTVTPFLNDRTAEYLGTLSGGNLTAIWNTLARTAKGELREQFNIEVKNDKGAASFAGLSGGEKRKVRLSTALALQDLVASRASKPVEIWIADEIDEALDPAGLERLMGILEDRARSRGTVLVISHHSLKEWISEVIVVQKSGNRSTVLAGVAA